MNTRHPISSVIPSTEGLVLEVLAGTTSPLTLTEVHGIAGDASLSGIRNALLRLVRGGLVEQVPGGYLLNRDHVAAGAVESLAQMRSALAGRISSDVERWDPPPALVGIFGSAARREGDDGSDIDVLVVRDATDTADRAGALALKVGRWTGNQCHVVSLSSSDLRRMRRRREPILEHWDRDLVVVAGDRLVLGGTV